MLQLLQLMQLSDGTLPIGTAAHSFGLESLAEWGMVRPDTLDAFVASYLQEQAPVDCCYARAAYTAAREGQSPSCLCQHLSAIRQPRESRDASISLGQRLLSLCIGVFQTTAAEHLRAAFHGEATHHVLVFGYAAALLEIEEDIAVAALLHQSIASILSSAQRLMPVGQRQATSLLWSFKPCLLAVVEETRARSIEDAGAFMPLLDIASMRHPRLETRLFLS